ncbi:MAG: hypothetical protein AB7K24_31985 [Gemmataceae bacterium]
MRFTVIWRPSATNELADIWVKATDRRQITETTFAIDQELSVDPESKGEQFDEHRRILIDLPLAVMFTVSEQDRMVAVLQVRLIEKRQQ